MSGAAPRADPRLGRLKQFDKRSRKFAAVDGIEEKPFRSFTWKVGGPLDLVLDQGSEGACVGFAWANELRARPRVFRRVSNSLARSLYFDAQMHDEWPGGAYPGASPVYEGTSVLAGAKAVQDLGFIGEYRWAFGLNDLRRAIGYKGPAVLGLNWYEGMMAPEPDGRIRPTGELLGGHAICAYSVAEPLRRIRLWNSWGADWGPQGPACYLTFDDMARLLAEEGEACVPTQRMRELTA